MSECMDPDETAKIALCVFPQTWRTFHQCSVRNKKSTASESSTFKNGFQERAGLLPRSWLLLGNRWTAGFKALEAGGAGAGAGAKLNCSRIASGTFVREGSKMAMERSSRETTMEPSFATFTSSRGAITSPNATNPFVQRMTR